MKNNYEWKKRRIKYMINNNVIGKIFMMLYYEFEELIWLGICACICVIAFKFVFFLGF
jgi:uncharacterized membrane protein